MDALLGSWRCKRHQKTIQNLVEGYRNGLKAKENEGETWENLGVDVSKGRFAGLSQLGSSLLLLLQLALARLRI